MAVGAGRTTCGLPEDGNDDIGRLASQVNRSLEQLKPELLQSGRSRPSVAHDLRAPLARLRMRLEPQVLENRPRMIFATSWAGR